MYISRIDDDNMERTHPLLMYFFSMISEIVDTPEMIEIVITSTAERDIFYVKPLASEIGQLIGTSGYIAMSLRNLMKCAAKRRNLQTVHVEIVSDFRNVP